MAAITTVCVVGFPADVIPRELKNLCRFAPGFEGANVVEDRTGKSPMLFIKFQTRECAEYAIASVNGRSFDIDFPDTHILMKAEYARRELAVRETAAPPLSNGGGPRRPEGSDRRREPRSDTFRSSSGAIETLAILGVRDKGLSHEDLQDWMQMRQGYMVHKYNEKCDGLFIRFSSVRLAEQAMDDAQKLNFGAEWARRNLDEEGAPSHDDRRRAPDAEAFPAKRSRNGGGGADEITTITVLGVTDKGLSADDLTSFFESLQGFVAVQANDRIGGIFAKFQSRKHAEKAMKDSNSRNYGAEWARRNLDL